MSIISRFGRVFKPLVNFPQWMGLRQLAANAQTIKQMFLYLKATSAAVPKSETFAEAIERLHLTEADIQNRLANCYWLSLIYAMSTLIFLVYTLYMIIHLKIGFVIGLLITVLMTIFTYRESFWYFQLKTRKLGNTFKDWVRFIFRGSRL